MAKKQFIRHLEYYGFPDQNSYSSEISGVDLSDIREKNKEQDEEIQDLEGEKADKKDLVELSGTVENFITRQSEINQEFANSISGMSGDIEELKHIDSEFAEQLSAITSGVDETMEAIEELDERVDNVEDVLSGINDVIETIDEDYAKKEDVYSKEEIDDMISSGFSGYATQEWVIEQGYITEEEADAKYAKKEDLEELANQVESAATDIDEKFEEINDSIDEINDKVDGLADDLSAFSEDMADINDSISGITSSISGINETIDEINDKVDDITGDIADLAEVVSGNTAAIEELNESVSAINDDIQAVKDELDTKADESDLQDLRTQTEQAIENLENTKADKGDIEFLSGAVDTVDAKLDAEIARSTSADTAMEEKVDELDAEVQEAVETVNTFDERIANVESGLTKEIADRIQGDLDLIGTSADTRDYDTIWGAKKYAEQMRRQAIASAETYTDNAVEGFSTELANLEADIDRKLSSAATTAYVESRITNVKRTLRSEFTAGIEAEKARATAREDALAELIGQIDVTEINEKIAKNTTKLHAITEWDGTDPAEYEDGGNGILDVLHREFHEYEKTHGSIKSIEYVDGNLIITYITPEGEKQEIIPISELIVLDDYYKKEETDALLDGKLDVSAYTDISEQVSANTENIAILQEEVSGKTDLTLFNALVERLGYTDNDTLERNNEYEVAFGKYNISNTSDNPSRQTVFSVGMGTGDDDRRNALEVRNNGDVYMWIEGDYMNVNKLLAQIAHEVYDNDSTHNSHFFDGD
jgi:DNA repair exonuclease SbcCD ATPase subunit